MCTAGLASALLACLLLVQADLCAQSYWQPVNCTCRDEHCSNMARRVGKDVAACMQVGEACSPTAMLSDAQFGELIADIAPSDDDLFWVDAGEPCANEQAPVEPQQDALDELRSADQLSAPTTWPSKVPPELAQLLSGSPPAELSNTAAHENSSEMQEHQVHAVLRSERTCASTAVKLDGAADSAGMVVPAYTSRQPDAQVADMVSNSSAAHSRLGAANLLAADASLESLPAPVVPRARKLKLRIKRHKSVLPDAASTDGSAPGSMTERSVAKAGTQSQLSGDKIVAQAVSPKQQADMQGPHSASTCRLKRICLRPVQQGASRARDTTQPAGAECAQVPNAGAASCAQHDIQMLHASDAYVAGTQGARGTEPACLQAPCNSSAAESDDEQSLGPVSRPTQAAKQLRTDTLPPCHTDAVDSGSPTCAAQSAHLQPECKQNDCSVEPPSASKRQQTPTSNPLKRKRPHNEAQPTSHRLKAATLRKHWPGAMSAGEVKPASCPIEPQHRQCDTPSTKPDLKFGTPSHKQSEADEACKVVSQAILQKPSSQQTLHGTAQQQPAVLVLQPDGTYAPLATGSSVMLPGADPTLCCKSTVPCPVQQCQVHFDP